MEALCGEGKYFYCRVLGFGWRVCEGTWLIGRQRCNVEEVSGI